MSRKGELEEDVEGKQKQRGRGNVREGVAPVLHLSFSSLYPIPSSPLTSYSEGTIHSLGWGGVACPRGMVVSC